jgi:hypothetical protein
MINIFQGQQPQAAMKLPKVPSNIWNKNVNSPIYNITTDDAGAKSVAIRISYSEKIQVTVILIKLLDCTE